MNDSEMEHRITAIEERTKANARRLDDVEEKVDTLNRLTSAVELMAAEQKHQGETMAGIEKDVNALGTKVDTIEKKPGKRWEEIVNKILCMLIGSAITLVLLKLGLPV